MKRWIAISLTAVLVMAGCATEPGGQTSKAAKGAGIGALAGAAAGALAGQAIGRDTQGTLTGAAIGAAVGAGAGAGIGHALDKQEQEYREALATSEAAAVRREGNLLAIVLKGDITFDTGSATVKPGLLSEIQRIAEVMKQYPQTNVIIEGHTDSIGSETANQTLSERRAETVANMLIEQGVNSARISTYGYGESQPLATNDTPDGRRLNRRVEIKIDPGQPS